MKWLQLSVEAHSEAVDAIANVFQENGTGGVAIHQPVQQDREGEDAPTFVGMPVIHAYLPMTSDYRDRVDRIERDLWHLQAFNLSPVGTMERTEIEEEDWANGWKEHFHPLRIGRVVIKPSWREWDSEPGDLIMELDPGMAFGTGLHPTTRLVVQALQERVRPGTRVLDLGCGSGILAMAAALLGATVQAIDISEVAVEVAEQNVLANGLQERVTVTTGSIDAATEPNYDLVFANIIARVLIDLAPQLASVLAPGADLLACGIIEERAENVRTAFREAGLLIVEETCEGDWWLIVGRRPQ